MDQTESKLDIITFQEFQTLDLSELMISILGTEN